MIKNKGKFFLGIALMLGFFFVLFLMFLPIYGREKENFLSFSDRNFNRLAKGSAYFIPSLKKNWESLPPTVITTKIKFKSPTDTPEAAQRRLQYISVLLTKTQFSMEAQEEDVLITGDLRELLKEALEDADLMYWNRGEELKKKYNVEDEKRLFRQWHLLLSQINKDLLLQKKAGEAKIVNSVLTKAIEPAYNFYMIQPQKLSEQAFMLTGLLIFYVIYTMWFGYSILLLFEGFGLSTKKAKIKKEV